MSGFIIIVIAFIVLSNILRLAGKTGAAGKGTGVPRRSAPPRSRPNAAGGSRRLPDGRTPLDVAATMIPEELWRVLTGHAPPAPLPSPAPAPRPREMQLELDDEIEEDEEAEIAAGRYAGEERSLEVADAGARTAADAPVRPAPAGAKTRAGSASPAPSGASNAATATLASPATAAAAPTDRVGELRRAILLREVLGTPKGLE